MATTTLTNNLKTPNVYIEEISKFPPSIVPVATAIPAFIGYTETAKDRRGRDLKWVPTRISSLIEYELYFRVANAETEILVTIANEDGPNGPEINATLDPKKQSKFRMYYALQLFFANGGGPCWIVSTGGYKGDFGRPDLEAGLKATEKIDEITLYVFPDAQGLSSAADYYGLYKNAINLCKKLQDRFTVTDVWPVPDDQGNVLWEEWNEHIKALRGDNGLANVVDYNKYAASYFPNLETTFDLYYGGEGTGDSNVQVIRNGAKTDLAALKAQPKGNALYYQARTAIRAIPCNMPPSPAVVGIYARVDADRGVWKAPANATVNEVIKPSVLLTDEEQGDLNIDPQSGLSINAIRPFPGRGILVWGARTLAGNDTEWRYVPVRRFFNMVEESAKNACKAFVFELNSLNTWTRVRSMIENFLTKQWRAGALVGTTTEEAYYVRVGLKETMTEEDLLDGLMIVEIGLAVVRPAEFIILQFSHKLQSQT